MRVVDVVHVQGWRRVGCVTGVGDVVVVHVQGWRRAVRAVDVGDVAVVCVQGWRRVVRAVDVDDVVVVYMQEWWRVVRAVDVGDVVVMCVQAWRRVVRALQQRNVETAWSAARTSAPTSVPVAMVTSPGQTDFAVKTDNSDTRPCMALNLSRPGCPKLYQH